MLKSFDKFRCLSPVRFDEGIDEFFPFQRGAAAIDMRIPAERDRGFRSNVTAGFGGS